jgi:predicted ATPase
MIERLYVNNFRCLQNFTFDLKNRSSAVLIGKNGAGKSTVLCCFEIFQSIGRGSRRVGEVISASDFTQHRTNEPMRLEIEFVVDGQRYSYVLVFEWPAEFREARIQTESLIVDGATIFTRDRGEITVNNGAAFGLDWHVFALPVVNERPPGRFIQRARVFLSSMVVLAPVPETITGFAEAPDTDLQRDGRNYAACLLSMLQQKPKAYRHFEDYIKEVMPDFSSAENPPRGESGTQLIVTFEAGDPPRTLPVEFKALSDGEKCFFLSAYLIASNHVGPAVTCIWDEPDNHLSLSQVGQFITALRKMAKQAGQFIGTTHHPETVRKFSDETTFVLTRESHLEPTVVRPLTDFEYQGDLVNALIRDEIIG